MREYVSNILDYNPQVDTYKKEVNDILNQVYLTHFTERPWEYAQREYDIEVFADQTFTGTTYARGVAVTPNEGSAVYGPNMVFEATVDADGIPKNKEYNALARFDIASNSYLILQDPVYQLDQYPVLQCLADNPIGGEEITFIMKHRHIVLPPDTIEILSIGLRGRQTGFRQPFFNLARYEDEKLGLDLDEVGVPTNWIETQPQTLPNPRIIPNLFTGAGTNLTQVSGYYQCAYTFTVTAATTRGVVDLESAPIFGEEQYFDVGVSLGVENIEATETYVGLFPTEVFRELRKNVYVKTPDSNHFVRVNQVTISPEQTDTSVSLGQGIDFAQPLLWESRPKLQENEGTYKTVRLYPRQGDDYLVKLRYHYRPKTLKDDQDVPQMPSDGHLFLCYGAIAELFYKHSNLSQGRLYEDKAKKELMKLENKYLTQKDKAYIKGGYRSSEMYYGRPFVKITRIP